MNNNTRNFNNKDKILCKFFLQGNCKNGAQCAWLHDEDKKKELTSKSGSGPPSNPIPAKKNPQPCFFYFSGNCTKCDTCPYSHELLFDNEETNLDATSKKSEGKVEAVAILMDKTMQQLIEDSKDKECSICFDGVVSQKRLFGLLSSCDHVYCLDCIRNWRATDQHDADKAVESVSHTCPMCRQLSLFVVPSPVHASGQIKDKITARYLQRLKQIPCKYFKYGTGYCPFNAACFYAHLNKDGSVATLEQNLRNKPRTRRRPGFLIDGQQPLIMSTRLLEMIMPFLSDTVRSQILAYSIDEEDEELFDEEDADVMSDDDSNSDSINMDYTHESDDSDEDDSVGRSGSGSDSNDASGSSYRHNTINHHHRSYTFYDSDSDAPERQLYDGNADPDGADAMSENSDSLIGFKYEQGDDSSNSGHSTRDSIEDSSSMRSGSDDDSVNVQNVDMDDSSISVPALSSDSIGSNTSTPREYHVESSESASLVDDSGSRSSPQEESFSSMSDDNSNSNSSSVSNQYGECDYNNVDSDDYVSD